MLERTSKQSLEFFLKSSLVGEENVPFGPNRRQDWKKGTKIVFKITRDEICFVHIFFLFFCWGAGGRGGFYFSFGGLEVRISLFFSFSYCWGLGTSPSFLVLEF
jgi:hypothetical protein